MSEAQTTYGVSYIASAPEELKVGDRVVVTDENDNMYEHCAVVVSLDKFYATIRFAGGAEYQYNPNALRKLPDTSNPMDVQVGGNHYNMPIQPVEFIERNSLGFCVGNCIKYLCRYKRKNGKEDLEKAKHYIDLLIQLEYPE